MRNLRYGIILILLLTAIQVDALDIQYGTIEGTQGSSFLVQYYGIGVKQNFLCNVNSLICEQTNKTNYGKHTKTKLAKKLFRQLKEKGAQHITISPSGKMLAYLLPATNSRDTRTYILRNLKTGQESTISESISYWDLINDEGRVFSFSPNNKKIAYLDDKDGSQKIYLSLAKNQAKLDHQPLQTSAYQIDDFIFTDNATIYYIGNTKDNPSVWSLYRYNLNTGMDKIIASNASYVDPIRKIGQTIVFNQLQAKGYGPSIYNLITNKARQFTIPSIETKMATPNEEVISSDTIHGVLMKPTVKNTTQAHPLLIWLHGGPYRETSYGYHPYHSYGIYDSILKLLAKNNVIVLKLDYPGSLGYGRNYAESIKNSVGNIDVQNVLDAINYAKSKYNINNVYLAGNSYGGYLSLKSLVEHPDIFTGVISINGVTDWESLLLRMRKSIFNTHFSGLPNNTNQHLYNQASIINRIGNIGNQKIAIIQGQSDHTIPPWQAELLYKKLYEQSKNVQIIRYADEDHVFKEKKNISDLCVQIFTFMGMTPDTECTQ